MATRLTVLRGGKNLFYHHTDKKGADAIALSGMIKSNHKGQLFLTRERISSKTAANLLFLGRADGKGEYVIEVELADGLRLVPGKNVYEFIFYGSIRHGRQAKLEVRKNDY